jgi:hypothetical protein
MNDDALLDLFILASEEGYNGDVTKFHDLLQKNNNAFSDAYTMARDNGYEGDEDSLRALLGLNKTLKQNVEQKFLKDLPELKFDMPKTGTTAPTIELEDELEQAKQNEENVKKTLEGDNQLTPSQLSANAISNMFTRIAGWDNRIAEISHIIQGDVKGLQGEELELNRLQSQIKPVIEPMDAIESFKDGVDPNDFSLLGASMVNAMTGLGVSVIERMMGSVIGAGAGAIGGGMAGMVAGPAGFLGGAAAGATTGAAYGGFAGMASDMIAQSIIDYNKEKAAEMGITYDELVDRGEAEIVNPATLGLLQAQLEKAQLGVLGRAFGKVSTGFKKFFAELVQITRTNGLQELGQETIAIVNEEAGRVAADPDKNILDLTPEEAGDIFERNKRRLANAGLNGVMGAKGSMIGGRVIQGGAKYGQKSLSKLVTIYRTDDQVKTQEAAFETLVDINDQRNNPDTTAQAKKVLDQVEQSTIDNLRDIQNENIDVIERLEPQEVDRSVEIYDRLNDISRNIGLIEKMDRDLATKRKYIKPLQDEIGRLTTELSNLRNEVSQRPDPVEAQVAVAPFYEQEVSDVTEAEAIRGRESYQIYLETINDTAKLTGVTIDGVEQAIGGYYLQAKDKKITEVSNVINVQAESFDDVVNFAALLGGLTPEVQEATIATRIIEDGNEAINADVITLSVSDAQTTLDALKELDFTDFTLNETNNTLTLVDPYDFRNEYFGRMDELIERLEQKDIQYEITKAASADSRYIGEDERKQILSAISKGTTGESQQANVLRDKIEQALGSKAGESPLTTEQQEVNEILKLQGKKPKYSTQQTQQDIAYDVDEMVEEMNAMASEKVNYNPTGMSTTNTVNVNALLERFPGVKIIDDVATLNGIPMVFTISDELTTGNITNGTSKVVHSFEGGSGFNQLYLNLAWANTTESKANESIQAAQVAYQKNKPLFDRLWDQGKIPYGHIPMAVIKMGDDGIYNNQALYEYSASQIKKAIPERNRVRAQKELVKLVKNNAKVSEFVSKYKTIDETMANIADLPLTIRKVVGDNIFTGNIKEDTKPGQSKKPVPTALLKGRPEDDRALIHARTVRNQIVDPSTVAIPQRHVLSIVGVDVLNPEVVNIDHKNYKFGVKGTHIGMLSNPVHAMDIFPEMVAKSISLKGRESMQSKTTQQLIQSSVMANGPVAAFKGYQGIKLSTKVSEMRTLMSQLKLSFPDVSVADTQQEFENKVAEPEVKKYVKRGDVIYGFTVEENGSPKIYINPEYASTKVLLHEYGHVWQDYLRQNNPELLQAGYGLLEGSEALYKAQMEYGDSELAREEALNELISNRGQSIVDASLKSRFLNWLNGMFNYIKNKFKPFSQMTADDFQNMTLEEFVDGSLASMLEGDSKKVEQIAGVRFSKQNIGDFMDVLVAKKFSFNAIKDALSDEYSLQDIRNAYEQSRTEFQEAQAKNEGLFDYNKNIFQKAFGRFHRTLTSSRGFKAKSQQRELEVMDGAVDSHLKQALVRTNDLVKKVRESGADPKLAEQQISMILEGKMGEFDMLTNKVLSDDVQEIVQDMRTHIDILQRQLLDGGYLTTAGQRTAVEKGIGTYLTRSYRIFDIGADKWNEELQATKEGQQIIQKARNLIRSQENTKIYAQELAEEGFLDYEEALEYATELSLQNILKGSDASPYIKSAREGGKDMNALRRRKDIPEEIMALMGVHNDPLQNYVRTTQRVSSLLASSKYLESVRKSGLNVFLFEKGDPLAPAEYKYEIAAPSTDSYSPLSGLLTTKEIRDALQFEPLLNGKVFNSPMFRYWLKGVASVKYGKTILSPGTHGKNILGNLFFMAMNGYTNPKAYTKAFTEVANQIKLRGETEISESLQNYIELGLIDKSVVRREIIEMFGDKPVNVESLLDQMNSRWWNNMPGKVGKAAEKAYQLEDDYFKIVSFEMEKERYARLKYSNAYNTLTSDQKTEVEQIAAENTKNIIPNYNRIGALREIMRSIPVFGTFISFQMESYRTAYNTIDLAIKEIKDPNLSLLGAKRLASVLAFQTLYHYTLKSTLGDFFGAIGDEEDEDEKVSKYLSLVLPSWSKNSDIVLTQAGDGKLTYVDLTASNPHGQITRAFNALMKGKSAEESVLDFMAEAFGPFVTKDILYSAASQVFTNEKPSGAPLFKAEDSYATRFGKAVQVLWKAFEPGIIRSGIKIREADSKLIETIGQATGYKPIQLDYAEAMGFAARNILNGTKNLTSYTQLNRRFKSGEITKSEFNQALDRYDEVKREIYADLVPLYEGALYFGISSKDATKALESAGVPRYIRSQIRKGRITKVRD